MNQINGNQGPKNRAPLVSVLIPSYNNAGLIRGCLQALLRQKTDVSFEIIVVDSSTDGTEKIVKNEFPGVQIHHFNRRLYVGEARNVGVEKAKGEFVFFVDTDCIVGESWIRQMHQGIIQNGVDGIGGAVENGTPWSISGTIGYYLEFFRFVPHHGRPRSTQYLVGCNSGYRKEVFESAKYYSNYNKERIGEDFVFNWQLMQSGKKVMFDPSVTMKHLNRTGFVNVFRYQYGLGQSAYTYRSRITPDILRPFKRLPILTYLIPFGTMAWIGSTFLRRFRFVELAKFILLLPLLYVANCVWSVGFYHELKSADKNDNDSVGPIASVLN